MTHTNDMESAPSTNVASHAPTTNRRRLRKSPLHSENTYYVVPRELCPNIAKGAGYVESLDPAFRLRFALGVSGHN